MLRKSILVLATVVAIDATAAHSGSTKFQPWGVGGSGRTSVGHWDRAHDGGFGSGDYMNGGRKRGDACDGLVGGTFAWPYCNYCTRHPGDQNC